PDGDYLYFASDRSGSMSLYRVRIDESSGRVKGEPQQISTSYPWSGFLSLAHDGGHIAYAAREDKANIERLAFDPHTGELAADPAPVTTGSHEVRSIDVSPDGERIVFDTSGARENLVVVRTDGKDLRNIVDDAYRNRVPLWSPRGERILFYSNHGAKPD